MRSVDEIFAALTDLSGIWVDRVHDRRPPKMVILDMDSSVSPTHGEQEGTAYNGHSAARAIILFSSSTSSATLNGVPCVPATFTVPMTGKAC